MRGNSFDQLVADYEKTLLDAENLPPNIEMWLQVLQSRDAIEIAQNNRRLLKTPSNLAQLIELDNRFRIAVSKQKPSSVDFSSWQSSIKPISNTWWWSLDQIHKTRKGNNLDGLWEFLIAACLVISLAMILDVIPKLLLDGPDLLGALAIIIQSLLVALSAGGTFTAIGKEAFVGFLQKADIPIKFWKPAKLYFTITILVILLIFRLSLPKFAIAYNNYGLSQYQQGNLASAMQNFQRSIRINPGYAEAHYNLGLIYEDLHDHVKARTEYNLALLGGLNAANNNLGHLYILDKDFAAAVSVLLPALGDANDMEIRYDLLKNLGWARLMQGRYDESETYLVEAKSIAPKKAPAHCLLAQVFYKKGFPTGEIESWEYCLTYAKNSSTDEDPWINLARQRMSVLGEKNEP